MNKSLIVITTFILFALSGCGSSTSTNTGNANTTNTNATANTTKPANNVLETTKTPEISKTNDAPTLTPVFKNYCVAMEKKDEAALRKIYSQETIKIFEADMKEEGEKSLAAFLTGIDKVSTKLCEVTNEKIQGDSATARIKAESYPNGISVVFVKEGGEWKMTNKIGEDDAVKKTATN